MYPTAEDLAGPPLPSWFLFPATAVFALLTAYVIFNTRGRAARYLIFVCWFRYTLSSLQQQSYAEAFGGLRWVGLGSLLSILVGVLLLDKRRFLSRSFAPVAVICALMVISAVMNGGLALAVEPILRFGFFVVIAVALWQALESSGAEVLKRLLIVFLPPVTFQLASIVLGVAKAGEIDGSVSYIGGFYHEELFSLILATLFVVVVLGPPMGRVAKLSIATISVVGISLANYRTTILGIAPLLITSSVQGLPRVFVRSQRTLAVTVVGIAAAALIVIGVAVGGDRFSDLKELTTQGTGLIRPPETFTYADQRVLSGRPYIWSSYLYAYGDASPATRVIGFGPDAWVGRFPEYAHNTVISFLFELGILGAAAVLYLWVKMFLLALRAPSRDRAILIGAHASFFVLNMATMPHWQIEGNILYGIICGYTLAKSRFPAGVGGALKRRVITTPELLGRAPAFQAMRRP